MSTAPGVTLELTQQERQFLLFCEHFNGDLTWREPAPINRQLHPRGFHDVDTEDVA